MCGGNKGGDGGAAQRKAAEDERQSGAISSLNRIFGMGSATAPDKANYTKPRAGAGGFLAPFFDGVPEFDQAGFDAAQSEFDASNGKPNAREGLYSKIAADSKALQLDDLGRDRGLAERDVGFDLARRGLSGGSREIDTSREIGDQFNRGVLTADNNSQGVANDARMSDEKTRINLINSIRSGMSDSDATSAAFNSMQNNANQAANNAKTQNIGGFFDAIRGSANQYQQADAQQKAFEKYRTGGGSGGSEYGGTVR